MANEIAKFVQSTISGSPVVVFSKTWCGYSKRVKKLFDENKTPYKAIELDTRPDETEIQQYLGSITGASTVPRVFISGKCIGGCDDTFSLQKRGELAKMIAAATSKM